MALGPQFEQLKMFMSPNEINPSSAIDFDATMDAERHEKDPEMVDAYMKQGMEQKLAAATGSGLRANIEKRGVIKPVQVIHTPEFGRTIGHGHHRFAAAQDIDPDALIPVHHTEGQVVEQKYGHRTRQTINWGAADFDYEAEHGSQESDTWNPNRD